MSTRESLLDTFPATCSIEHSRTGQRHWGGSPAALVDAIWPEELIEAAADAVSRYLYSDDCAHVAHLDTNEPNLCEFNTAALAALSKLSTFGSPIVLKKARRVGDINYSVVLCCRCIRVA